MSIVDTFPVVTATHVSRDRVVEVILRRLAHCTPHDVPRVEELCWLLHHALTAFEFADLDGPKK